MQISWLGYSAFRLQNDGTTTITDPSLKGLSFSINRQGADIVIASNEKDEPEKAVTGKPFAITMPGEYEVRSVFVQGVRHEDRTLYLITIDGVSIAFIGAMKIKELSESQLAVLEGADILIVPVGDGPVCSVKDAVSLINQIEPRIVIPSCYKSSGTKGLDSLDVFLKEYSAPKDEVDKLKIHRKDLPQEDTRITILQRS